MITYHLKISGQDPRVLFSDMEFVTGDVGAYRLVFSFFDQQAPLSLADKVLSVKIKRADGVVLSDSGEVTGDTAVYIPKNDCFCVPGTITFEIALMDSAKHYVTTKIIHASVLEGVGEPREVAGDNSSVFVTLLAQAKTQLDAANQACVAAKALLSETQNSLTEKADVLFITTETATSHTVSDIKDGAVFSLSVFGKTAQNGTPTPQNPIDLVSVENPTLTIGDQTVTIPYTLRGIGDVKDEIVVDGKNNTVRLIQRIERYVFQGTETLFPGISDKVRMFGAYANRFKAPASYDSPKVIALCTKFANATANEVSGQLINNRFCISPGVGEQWFYSTAFAGKSLNEVRELLKGVEIIGEAKKYKETDITDTECGKALLSLAATYPQTSVVCDADCKFIYQADTTNAYSNLKSELDTLKQAILLLGGTI